MSIDLIIDEISVLIVAPQSIQDQDQDPSIIDILENEYSDIFSRFPSKRFFFQTALPSNWSDEYDDTFVYVGDQGKFELLEHPMPMNLE